MIEINNLTRTSVSETFLKRTAKSVLMGERKQQNALSIALVGPKKAAALNKKYRRKNSVANVLSFPGEGEELGEVILCPVQIRQDARTYDMIFEQVLAWMLIHGILHLVGYSHKKEREAKLMEKKERFYLELVDHSCIRINS
jgi:probable rRNA maturation factor